jgi:hypothetical protein
LQNSTLSLEEKDLLRKCLSEYKPDLIEKVDLLDSGLVDVETIKEMREAIGTELQLKGFKINWEPNQYGLKLEYLIDKLADLYL